MPTLKELLLHDSPTARPQLPRMLIDALRHAVEADLSVEQIAAAVYLFAGIDVMAGRLPPDVLVDRAKMMSTAMTETIE